MLSVNLAGITFPNLILNASGAFNPGLFSQLFPLKQGLGGIVTKTVTQAPRAGNEQQRTAELPGVGMLNSIGLQNPGLDYTLDTEVQILKSHGLPLILSISASSAQEFAAMAKQISEHPLGNGVDALELNLSCPNVKEGGIHFGTSCTAVGDAVHAVVSEFNRPVFAKLTPNVSDVVPIAAAAIESGAAGLTAINTLLGASINIKTKKPQLKRVSGGYSGPGIKPVAIHMVWQLRKHFPNVPIIGVGGITTAEDVLEFVMAGANLVQVGTSCFRYPTVFKQITEELEQYCAQEGLTSLDQLSAVHMRERVVRYVNDAFPEKHVKIIATIGPASDSLEVLEALVNAGVNVIRLNMSHGTQEDHQNRIARIRVMARKLERSLGILADLQGPKIRTGLLEDHQPILLTQGEVVRFTCATPLGKPGVITTNFEPLLTDLQPGHTVLMDDGQLRLKVMFRVDEKTLDCQVLQGGLLDEHKGINVPEISLGVSALTEKDKADALFCLEEGVDFFALSFVRSAQDILDLRDWIQSHGHDVPPIIAKIEKPQALEEIASILQAADGLMVARGDLGVELPSEQVPVLQKMLVETANNAGKPVIIATQMLESMINSVQPTRAEVSDVANGVFDGTDALMLSGESAKGKHPIEAVSMMNRIIIEAEKNPRNPRLTSEVHVAPLDSNFSDAIAHSAVDAAFKANAKAIVVFSNSGKMALRVSKLKPNQEIIVLTPHLKVYQQLSLLWGVTPVVVPWGPNTDETLAQGEALILSRKLLEEGDTIVFCAGATPFHGATNMLKVYRIGSAILS